MTLIEIFCSVFYTIGNNFWNKKIYYKTNANFYAIFIKEKKKRNFPNVKPKNFAIRDAI